MGKLNIYICQVWDIDRVNIIYKGIVDKEYGEYYSAMWKKKEILQFATSWMAPWGHYAEISHTEKDKFCIILLIFGI